MNDFKELQVWQKAIILVEEVYKTIEKLPNIEKFNLSDQIRRSAVSIPSNIAEGFSRQTAKDYIHFLYFSSGSLSELETQYIISKKEIKINESFS
ncbi:MAG: four helix bundle protein [bacterium]|nr:four helix bundle protein [bacterium]